ncbi:MULTISPECIES: sigma-54 dependent transcriptional regulator [Massilia]|uniref:Sigma 54-interacting transcriptional regulator n=1 Tax=Massilia haematophila TaxID=457923 RepID=A0ABV7PH85_9BURK|nr:sigma 54-interacting transcriptional regulator [Massilia sp.]
MTPKRLLCIAPDSPGAAAMLRADMPDWEIRVVASLDEARSALRQEAYLVGLLVHVIGARPHPEVDRFLRQHSQVQWVGVLRAESLMLPACRDLVADYLCDYHTTPLDMRRLVHTLGHVHGHALLRRPRPRPGSTPSALIGSCETMQRLRGQVERVAKVDAPVLIWGESGSGKELTAQAIHRQSLRATGPLVPINCGAIAPNLIHSELFGYERGAFTGAARDKVGLIESANGGTLFLDEIGDLPKDLQANLLRFLQDKTIIRLGATRAIPVDVRVISASHVNLQQAVARGDFREDLYYRLSVLPVTVPPLRERREDLVELAEHFFHLYAADRPARLKGFSSKAVTAIAAHNWPGNVRELINRVRRAMVMADGKWIEPDDLDLAMPSPPIEAVLDDARCSSERLAIRACLDRSGQNVSRAARDLGVSRTTMYRLLAKHGMRP